MQFTLVSIGIVLGFFIVGYFLFQTLSLKPPQRTYGFAQIGSTTISVEYAKTPLERERGLSGREPLKEASGMLFVFEKPGFYGFWMKDMHFPIDILWLNHNKMVVSIERDVSPSSYPTVFKPFIEAEYVIEVPSGFSDAHNIREGIFAKWESSK